MMHLERSQLRRYIDTGNSPNRTGMGRLLESLVRCKDGNYVILILSSQKQWEGLYEAMGRPEWGQDEKFLTQASRSQNYPELRDRLADWASQYDAQDVFETVQEQKSACAPAYTAEQFYNSPQIISREYLREIEHPIAGTLRYPGLPYKFSDMPEVAVTGAPILGQDNDAVLAEGVGVEAEDMVRLRQAGVI
jgi:CoA:oxalate CoA-transferase